MGDLAEQESVREGDGGRAQRQRAEEGGCILHTHRAAAFATAAVADSTSHACGVVCAHTCVCACMRGCVRKCARTPLCAHV